MNNNKVKYLKLRLAYLLFVVFPSADVCWTIEMMAYSLGTLWNNGTLLHEGVESLYLLTHAKVCRMRQWALVRLLIRASESGSNERHLYTLWMLIDICICIYQICDRRRFCFPSTKCFSHIHKLMQSERRLLTDCVANETSMIFQLRFSYFFNKFTQSINWNEWMQLFDWLRLTPHFDAHNLVDFTLIYFIFIYLFCTINATLAEMRNGILKFTHLRFSTQKWKWAGARINSRYLFFKYW